MIYVFKAGDFIKIGYSKSGPEKRLVSVQTGCPLKVSILYMRQGGFVLENILQKRLDRFCVSGEWFSFSEECHSDLLSLFMEFNMKNFSEKDLARVKKSCAEKSDRSIKIRELRQLGWAPNRIAKELGVHRATVFRHS